MSEETNSTIVNKQLMAADNIEKGTIVFDKYEVLDRLDIKTGEADLYTCMSEGNTYILKLYRRRIAIKSEIVKKLADIDSPYVAKIYDAGEYSGFPIEILPYYRNGSLQGKTFDYEYLKKYIIPSLNNGLRVLHENGIIHKDLKPSNIMMNDNCQDVAIIDFGISSVRDEDNTVILTRTGMTPEYSAPETFKNLFLTESDYYSLGITVFELFYGHTPYNSMDKEKIEQYVSVQHIPFPEGVEIPDELKDFIKATTYYDITNRNNKTNPNRRWGYEEVKKWCEGVSQPIPGEAAANEAGDMKPYTFLGNKYINKSDLIHALVENWEDGKKQLVRGLLSGFFKSFDPEVAGFCMDAEEEAAREGDREDIIFWETLYKLKADTCEFYWKGRIYSGLGELGKDLLEHLWNADNRINPYIDDILKEEILSGFVKMVEPDNKKLLKEVMELEHLHKEAGDDIQKKYVNYYTMAYILSGQKIMRVNDSNFQTTGQLISYMRELLKNSYEEFEEFCDELIEADDSLVPQFEGWLLALGKKEELKQWKNDY